MTKQEQEALRGVIEWKHASDVLTTHMKEHPEQDDEAVNEKRRHHIMHMHKANLALHAVAADLIESYVVKNPKTLGEIQA